MGRIMTDPQFDPVIWLLACLVLLIGTMVAVDRASVQESLRSRRFWLLVGLAIPAVYDAWLVGRYGLIELFDMLCALPGAGGWFSIFVFGALGANVGSMIVALVRLRQTRTYATTHNR